MHCSTDLGKMHSPQVTAAVQNRLTAGLCHSNYTYGDLLFIQRCAVSQQKCTAALGKAKCIVHCAQPLCKTGPQQVCVTAITPMEICSSHGCAVSQQKCTAALLWAKCIPHSSQLLCKTGSQQAFVTAITPMGICSSHRCAVTQHRCTAALFKAKCSTHCSVLLCKTGSQQAVCHCSYTCEHLLYKQVCSDPAQMHCSSVQGKMQYPLLSAALQNRLAAGSVTLQLHLWTFALHTSVQ